MEKKRFRVRLVRPVFEYADVEVEAGEEFEAVFTALAGEKKYLLLKADTGSGEGEVVYQPWIGAISDLMLADLCADWTGELAEAGEAGVAGFYDWAERHARFLKEGPAKVIPLRPRREEE